MPRNTTYRDLITAIALLFSLTAILVAIKRRPGVRYPGLLDAIRRQTLDVINEYAKA